MCQPSYVENQRFGWWVYAIVIAGLPLIVLPQLAGIEEDGPIPAIIALVVFLVAAFVCNLLLLRIRVEAGHVRVSLGYLFPVFWRTLPLEAISAARPVTYRPLVNAGGWGLRFGRFEGRWCQFWNARGDEGVLLKTEKGAIILGSQNPGTLAETIAAQVGVRRQR